MIIFPLNAGIALKIFKSDKLRRHLTAAATVSKKSCESCFGYSMKSTKMLLLVSTVFLCCNIPYNGMRLYNLFYPVSKSIYLVCYIKPKFLFIFNSIGGNISERKIITQNGNILLFSVYHQFRHQLFIVLSEWQELSLNAGEDLLMWWTNYRKKLETREFCPIARTFIWLVKNFFSCFNCYVMQRNEVKQWNQLMWIEFWNPTTGVNVHFWNNDIINKK